MASTVQFIGGQATQGQGNYAPQNNQMNNNAPAANSNDNSQDYNITTDASFASDDIPF